MSRTYDGSARFEAGQLVSVVVRNHEHRVPLRLLLAAVDAFLFFLLFAHLLIVVSDIRLYHNSLDAVFRSARRRPLQATAKHLYLSHALGSLLLVKARQRLRFLIQPSLAACRSFLRHSRNRIGFCAWVFFAPGFGLGMGCSARRLCSGVDAAVCKTGLGAPAVRAAVDYRCLI